MASMLFGTHVHNKQPTNVEVGFFFLFFWALCKFDLISFLKIYDVVVLNLAFSLDNDIRDLKKFAVNNAQMIPVSRKLENIRRNL